MWEALGNQQGRNLARVIPETLCHPKAWSQQDLGETRSSEAPSPYPPRPHPHHVLLFAAGASCRSNKRQKQQPEADSTPESQHRVRAPWTAETEGGTEDSRTVTLELRAFGREYFSFCIAVVTKNKVICLKQYEYVDPSVRESNGSCWYQRDIFAL